MGRKIGYARVSTAHQNTDSQVEELKDAGCEEVFYEKVSSTATLDKRNNYVLLICSDRFLLVVSKLTDSRESG